ncbi:MAG: glycosyltransferase family 2 protein [Desulfobacteraceae bacterium]|nr:MAG: glycosyltransferase family 2 protein [Desulfobacteraceae bacterium]
MNLVNPIQERVEETPDHICVCVCTYKRPQLLLRLLKGIEKQNSYGFFSFSAVVVDNDENRSAQSAVESFTKTSSLEVKYFLEPNQNISLARNKTVAEAEGKYLAFIDDDEFPEESWLFHLYATCLKYKAHAVLGPVEPYYESDPPEWVVKGRMCERDHFRTGTSISDPKYTRTGNVLLLKEICRERPGPFDPSRGRSGGEDHEFFAWMIERGLTIFWCNEAPVYESVPSERLKRGYFLKRGLLRGGLNAKGRGLISFDTMKSLVAISLYSAALPLLAVLGHHLLMKYLIKSSDHAGKLLGRCGFILMRERTF